MAQLDPTQRQKVIDELKKLGKDAGGRYAAALAERLEGGTKDALDDAKAAIKREAITESDISSALDKQLKIEEQRKNRRRSPDKDTKAQEIEIRGQRVKLTRAEVQAFKDGDIEMMAAIKERKDKELAVMEELEARNQKALEESQKKEEKIRRRRLGLADDPAQDANKTFNALAQATQGAFGEGEQSGKNYLQGLETFIMANPVTLPSVQMPAPDFGQWTTALQTQVPQIASAISGSFANMKLTLPAPNLDGFFQGIIDRINTSAETVETALATAFSGINLSSVGVNVGKTLTEGIVKGIDVPSIASAVYEKFSSRLMKELRGAA
jgi:hypothetical protein